jgi:apolipoprotein D and lipocalin family protein
VEVAIRRSGLWRMLPIAVGLLALNACAIPPKHPDVVPTLDLARFTGTWYEIARLPDDFEDPRGHRCEDVAAVYRLRADGGLDMRHTCRDVLDDNAERVSTGRGYPAQPDSAKLRVSFQWPFYTDLWITDLDPDYRWAVVGSPSRRYLWVLSRTPTLSAVDFAEAQANAKAVGFDVAKLQRTSQLP